MKRKREDDQHQYAMNEKCEWVHIRDASKDASYYCDCPEHHKLKLVSPSGREGKRSFTDYFAHYGKSTNEVYCMYRLAKHRIRELASTLSFATEQCPECKWTKQFHSDGHTVRIEVQSIDKRWRYDCLLFDALGTPVFALEVVHTHFSSGEKIESTRSSESGRLGFAEFMADDVLQSVDGVLRNMQLAECLDCPNCKEISRVARMATMERETRWLAQAPFGNQWFISSRGQSEGIMTASVDRSNVETHCAFCRELYDCTGFRWDAFDCMEFATTTPYDDAGMCFLICPECRSLGSVIMTSYESTLFEVQLIVGANY